MIQLFRAKPELLNTEFGRAFHLAAIKKIKGTPWEKVLYPEPKVLADEKMLAEFRKAFGEELNEIRAKYSDHFELDQARSEAYVKQVIESKKGPA